MDNHTILFIKNNIGLLNYFVTLISFIVGISPLFMNREKLEKKTNPMLLELSAIVFLTFTIVMFTLDHIINIPVYKKHTCITMKRKYLYPIEFLELKNSFHDLKIINISDENYLVKRKYTNQLFTIPIKEDYKYYYSKRCF